MIFIRVGRKRPIIKAVDGSTALHKLCRSMLMKSSQRRRPIVQTIARANDLMAEFSFDAVVNQRRHVQRLYRGPNRNEALCLSISLFHPRPYTIIDYVSSVFCHQDSYQIFQLYQAAHSHPDSNSTETLSRLLRNSTQLMSLITAVTGH